MVLALFTGVYIKTSGQLSPGRLSNLQRTGEPLGGFSTHAQFEHNCQHCHAPVHCVSDTHCQDCHQDVAEQRAQAAGLHGRLPNVTRCQACHIEHQGANADITRFAFANVNHESLSGFSLDHHLVDYAGAPMHCDSCHTQERILDETLDCLTCHAEADHDFLAEHVAVYGGDCLACHDGVDRLEGFTHDQVYPLDGAHADAPCADCHSEYVFAGTPRDCAACHSEPDLHAGQFGQDCERCHGALAWTPALMTQHTFVLEHGGAGTLACQTCHPETFARVTCYGCHDHMPADTEAAHLAQQWAGRQEVDTCQACHPTGAAGEAALSAEVVPPAPDTPTPAVPNLTAGNPAGVRHQSNFAGTGSANTGLNAGGGSASNAGAEGGGNNQGGR